MTLLIECWFEIDGLERLERLETLSKNQQSQNDPSHRHIDEREKKNDLYSHKVQCKILHFIAISGYIFDVTSNNTDLQQNVCTFFEYLSKQKKIERKKKRKTHQIPYAYLSIEMFPILYLAVWPFSVCYSVDFATIG